MKPKKRWAPRDKFQKYYFIDFDGGIFCNYGPPMSQLRGVYSPKLRGLYSFLGVYKTKREAEAMLKKIKNFVTKEIGGV